jgi:micrococcal nuclease
MRVWLLLAILVAPLHALAAQRAEVLVVQVESGDVLRIAYAERHEKVRLIGIVCPAPSPASGNARFNPKVSPQGDKARAFVGALLTANAVVSLEFDKQIYDSSGRLCAYVYLADGRMLNEILLKEGLAKPLVSPPNIKHAKQFKKIHQKAQKKS